MDLSAALKRTRPLLQLHRGLYLQILRNGSVHAVFDRNGELKGRHKPLIPAGATTIKIGKFVGGFLARRSADAIHMHRRLDGSAPRPRRGAEFLYPPELHTYLDCLVRILVLDLGDLPKSHVASAEAELRRQLDEFLRCENVDVLDRRGEYRVLKAAPRRGFLTALQTWARSEFRAIERTFLRGAQRGRRVQRASGLA